MTREEAIKRLEWLRMVGNYVDSVTLGKEDMPYFDMAISALREQEERSKGCIHCRSGVGICPSNRDNLGITFHSAKGKIVAYGEDRCGNDISVTASIKFCPMCGRRLEEV